MIWLILLFLTYVRADDDSLDFGPPKFPPKKNALVAEQMTDEILTAVRESFGGSSKTGDFAYPKMSILVPELSYMMKVCYTQGMGAPKMYLFDETIFDTITDKELTIEKGEVYCSPGYSGKFYYEYKGGENHSNAYQKSLTRYKNKISNAEPERVHAISAVLATTAAAAAGAAAAILLLGPAGIAAAAAAAYMTTYSATYAGRCAYIPGRTLPLDWCGCGLTFPKIPCTPTNGQMILDHTSWTSPEGVEFKWKFYPYNLENARDYAVSKIKQSYDMYQASPSTQAEYCRKWNTIAGDGKEYFNPPKYITGRIETLKEKIVWNTRSRPEYGWENLKMENVFDSNVKAYSPPFYGSTALHARVSCSHYGLTEVGEVGEDYDPTFINHHPHIEASPGTSNSCGDDCKPMYLTEPLTTHWTMDMFKDAYLSFEGETITERSARPDDKLFCMRDHNKIQNSDPEERAVDMWVNNQIMSAQFAVFTWAQKHCKLYGGSFWTIGADFSCLLGASDIVMKGQSQTIPLPSGLGAGVTFKKFLKQGISIIVRNKYSYCISTEEYAEMAGAKITMSPTKFAAARAKAKAAKASAKAAAKNGVKEVKEDLVKETLKQKLWKNTKSYGKKLLKTGLTVAVREKQTAIRNGFEGNFKRRAEYWLEEGSCGAGCSLTRRNDIDEAWNMVAGSLSFFSAKTSVSYIRAYEQTGDGNTGWDRYFVQLFAQITIPNAAQIALTELDAAAKFADAFQISLEVAAGSATLFAMYDNFGNNPKDDAISTVLNSHWLRQVDSTSRNFKSHATDTHTTYLNKFTSSGQTPVNHRLHAIPSRRRLDTSYSIPDLALSDGDAIDFDPTTPIGLDRRGVRRDFDINMTGNIGSLIHGVQDIIEHNNILTNPFVYTKLNESTLELQYRGSPYHIATLRSCEAFGYVSVQLIDHEFNTGLQPILDYMQNTGKIDINHLHDDTFTYSDRGGIWSYSSEWTYRGDTPDIHVIAGETIDFSNTSIYENTVVQTLNFYDRPSGLIIGPMREEGYRDLRQTMDNFDETQAGSKITQHTDCSDNMQCVCVLAEGFAYVKYGDIKHLKGYMIHPIYSNYQCHLAKMHIQNDTFSFQEWNEVLEGPAPVNIAISSIATSFGCVMHGDEIKFNTAGTKGTIVDNSIVKLYEITDPQNSYDYAGDTINVHRQNPFDTMKEKHDIIDKQFHMVENGQPVRFPRHTFGALKDKNALHTVHEGTFKTIRRVDRYYKKNKDVVEEYYMDGEEHTIEYLNLKTINPKSNKYGDTTIIPPAHFVANSSDIGTDITVPKMDFVRNGLVAFSGQDINMPQLRCRSLFDYTGPAKYYDGEFTNITGLDDVICGEVSPPTLDNSISCEKSLSLPNTCPAGYGMDGEGTDDDGYAFDLGGKRQCAKCPVVPTCNGACERCLGTDSDTCENPQACKECLSPSGSYRCEVDLTNCDKPGYVETFVRRGGPDAQVSRHCVKTFVEPAYLPWQASTLQKHHHRNGNPFYPHNHTANGMKWIQNEVYSETRYLVCNPGYVPTQEIFDTADTLEARIIQYSATCAGYTCKKCPDGFYEKDQICMKCLNRQIANATGTGCKDVYVPKGHFFNLQNNRLGCNIDADDKTTCESTSVNTWLGCSDGISETEIECLAETKYTWGAVCDNATFISEEQCLKEKTIACSDGISASEQQCLEDSKNTWEVMCSDPNFTSNQSCTSESANTWGETSNSVNTWSTKCSNIGFYTKTNCLEQKTEICTDVNGTDVTAEYPSYESCIGDEFFWSMTNISVNTWSELCDDGISETEEQCLEEKTIACSDGISASEQQCLEDSKNTWGIMCSDPTLTSEEDCLRESANTWGETSNSVNKWTLQCSQSNLTTENECLAESKYTWYGCSDTRLKTQSACLQPKGVWNDQDDLFISSCDHWLDHPGGSMGAYQDEENQIVCKTVNTTKVGLGRHVLQFKGGIVDDWGVKGWRVSQDRTEAVQCKDHQRCNGEEVSGCKSGYIWKEYNENKDIDPCEQCNVDEEIKGLHVSRDAYEICDGTHRFRCAVASYTDATPDTFQTHITPHHQAGDIFVGVRASWNGSSLVVPKSEVRGSLSASFRWKNDFNSNLPRAEQYVHNPVFQPRRVFENPPFNPNGQCSPVPDGTFALPDLWQKTDCGAARDLCVDRTFHNIIPYKKDCVDADKYAFTAGIVKEECYDEIFRGSSRTCTDGEKIGGCNREPCQEEGATNCWCADEPDFCTMGCVNDLCQEICGDRVCEEYELCYGEFNQFVSFARCAIECQPPISNYCVVREGENTKYCRHYNDDFNSTILQKAYPGKDTPCFDEVPNIPETQCEDVFATSCFCGREYFDPPHTHESGNYACLNQVIEPVCSVSQDDGTCIYETSSSGECICGSEKIDLWGGETCYKTSKCGLNANPRPLCENVLGREIPCIAADYNIVDNENCYNGKLNTVYNSISETSYKCTLTGERVNVTGCVDVKGNNHNPYATIPWTCNYNK